jgi:hypothetical protein
MASEGANDLKLYVDMCCLKRPFDDQSDARVQLEATALESVIQLCRDGTHTLVASDALRFENSRNPNPDRQMFARSLLDIAQMDVPNSAAVEERAKVWQNAGIELLDALHLASA